MIWFSSVKASLVISPKSPDEVAYSVKLITSFGFTVIPRGGGMSYTGGYTPLSNESVIIEFLIVFIIKFIKYKLWILSNCSPKISLDLNK